MVTVTHEVAQKVKCLVCGAEKFALKAPYVCHGCWESGAAAKMIQRLTQIAPDVCHECGESETIDPNNDGVPTCVHCGTRR